MAEVAIICRRRYARRRAAAAALFVCALAAAYVLYAVEPGNPFMPPCLLFKFTGIYCPGCGNTRALSALMHGDIGAAIRMNAFTVLLTLPLGVALALSRLPPFLGFRAVVPRLPVGARGALIFMGALLLFGILRNIPALYFFAPG